MWYDVIWGCLMLYAQQHAKTWWLSHSLPSGCCFVASCCCRGHLDQVLTHMGPRAKDGLQPFLGESLWSRMNCIGWHMLAHAGTIDTTWYYSIWRSPLLSKERTTCFPFFRCFVTAPTRSDVDHIISHLAEDALGIGAGEKLAGLTDASSRRLGCQRAGKAGRMWNQRRSEPSKECSSFASLHWWWLSNCWGGNVMKCSMDDKTTDYYVHGYI